MKEVWIRLIDIFKIFVVSKIYFLQGVFISINRIIIKRTEFNFFVHTSSFNSTNFPSAVNELVVDKSTFLHLPGKFCRGDLPIWGQLVVYYYKLHELEILSFVIVKHCSKLKIILGIIRNCRWHKSIAFASCMVLILIQVYTEVTENVYYFLRVSSLAKFSFRACRKLLW